MMNENKIFKGIKYNFRILVSLVGQKQSLFAIKATHKQTKRTSFISTVNVILSELNINSDVPRFWESEWLLDKEETSGLITSTEQLFSDKKFLLYLERYLDLDRRQSEWENHEQL